MDDLTRLRAGLGESLSGADTALDAADRLCRACVELLHLDGASISLIREGASQGTFGSSNELSRRLDEYQFTYGEGPCLDAVSTGLPVLAPDLEDAHEHRWPAFTAATVSHGVLAVFALPVVIASTPVGALDLFHHQPGALSADRMNGSRLAAQLASVPLLALMRLDFELGDEAIRAEPWDQLASLERVEVHQATGMIMGALDVSAPEALVRLRAYAYAQGMTASEVAWLIVERRLMPDADDWWRGLHRGGEPT